MFGASGLFGGTRMFAQGDMFGALGLFGVLLDDEEEEDTAWTADSTTFTVDDTTRTVDEG